jgi:hypothetical protein
MDSSNIYSYPVTMIPENDAPVIDSQKVITTPEETPVVISLSDLYVTDPDNTWQDDFTLIIHTGTYYTVKGDTIIPDPGNGLLTVPVQVYDGQDSSLLFGLGITVTPVNNAPVITGHASFSVPEDNAFLLLLAGLTVDDPDNTYPVDFTLVLHSGNNYTFSGDTVFPAPEFSGTLNVPVQVYDGEDSSNVYSWPVEITAQNDAPVIDSAQALSTPEETPRQISVTHLYVTDPDNTFPADFTLVMGNGVNYTLRGDTVVPATDFNGTLNVPMFVTDGTDSSNVFFLPLEVMPVNDPPVVDSSSPGGSVEVAEGDSLLFRVYVTDSDTGDVLNYTWTWNGDTVDQGASASFMLKPGLDESGNNTLKAVISDGSVSASKTWSVTVPNTPVPSVPLAPALGAQAGDSALLIWQRPDDPDLGSTVHYRLELSEDSLFSSLADMKDSLSDTSIMLLELEGLDGLASGTKLFWRVSASDDQGYSTGFPEEPSWFLYMGRTEVSLVSGMIPLKAFADNVYPNPFRSATTLRFGVPSGSGGDVRMSVYNFKGRHLDTRCWRFAPGIYTLEIGQGFPSGACILHITIGRDYSRSLGLRKIRE